MAIDAGFKTLAAVRVEPQDGRKICGAETTSGSVCRAAPMANGRCVQHGGQPDAATSSGRENGAGGSAFTPLRTASHTIDRASVELARVAAQLAELPLSARQQLVPELRALATAALSLYDQLLAQNRREAAAKVARPLRG